MARQPPPKVTGNREFMLRNRYRECSERRGRKEEEKGNMLSGNLPEDMSKEILSIFNFFKFLDIYIYIY
jgi:hypothetical protein